MDLFAQDLWERNIEGRLSPVPEAWSMHKGQYVRCKCLLNSYNKTCTETQGRLHNYLGKALSAHSYSGLYPGKQDAAQMGTGTFPVGLAVGAQSDITSECRTTSDPPIERSN